MTCYFMLKMETSPKGFEKLGQKVKQVFEKMSGAPPSKYQLKVTLICPKTNTCTGLLGKHDCFKV